MDVQTVANSTGVTTRMLRDPYGAPIGSSGVWGSGTGYMDKPATASTGLTTVGARTYDPVVGKFLSVDPVIDTNLPQQNTGYTYSGNNPTTYMDPSGLRLTIECEPRCPKGSATVAQNLTRNQKGTQDSSPADYHDVAQYAHQLLNKWSGSKASRSLASAAPLFAREMNESIGLFVSMSTEKRIPQGLGAFLAFTWRTTTDDNFTMAAYINATIMQKFKSGGVWDAKPYIKDKFGYSAASDLTSYVYAAGTGKSVRSDVFGNVNYAIMAASYGISEDAAITTSRGGSPTTGVSDSTDDRAISLGYQMAELYPDGVPADVYESMIFDEFGE
ncbi:RHS repeat-associated core domain-containing protein [Microbacterium natoriense]